LDFWIYSSTAIEEGITAMAETGIPEGYRLISLSEIDAIRAAVVSVNGVLNEQDKRITTQDNRLLRLEESQGIQAQQQTEVLKQLIKVDNAIEQINSTLKEQKEEEKANRASMIGLRNAIIVAFIGGTLAFVYTQIFPRIEYNHTPSTQTR
jgi:CRISPR/Cas system CMR subunit Cmr4 (Cas7 group RAMP superfamily)